MHTPSFAKQLLKGIDFKRISNEEKEKNVQDFKERIERVQALGNSYLTFLAGFILNELLLHSSQLVLQNLGYSCIEIKSSSKKVKLWIGIMILYALLQGMINVIACTLYAMDGYINHIVVARLELTIAIYFTIEMIGNFYVYPPPKFMYFSTIDFWVDIGTVFPEYATLILGDTNMKSVGFLRILRVFKIMRIVKFK